MVIFIRYSFDQTEKSNLLVPCLGFDGQHDFENSPDDKDGKRDEKDKAKPIHRLMERFDEEVYENGDDEQ